MADLDDWPNSQGRLSHRVICYAGRLCTEKRGDYKGRRVCVSRVYNSRDELWCTECR